MKRLLPALLLLAVLLTPIIPQPSVSAAPAAQVAPAANDSAFDHVWERTDELVVSHNVARTWYWGVNPFARLNESFADAAGGSRLVQYYDKGRMEINDPNADRSNPYFVTNGRLVAEMVQGQVQVGLNQYQPLASPQQAIVGDGAANPAPTYLSLKAVANVGPGSNGTVAPRRIGQLANATLDQAGSVASNNALANAHYAATRIAAYSPQTGHNIPAVFMNFLTQSGQVLNWRVLYTDQIMNWVATMGYPITEPYWVHTTIGGRATDVLVQVFERRILSYNPNNDPAWQVEMTNLGRHYYAWRYGSDTPGALGQLTPIAVRVVAPAAHVDTGIIETYVVDNVWQVADYAAGHLYGTSYPGQPGNSVYAGHNNWHGEVFRDLYLLQPGDTFTMYMSDGTTHHYRVDQNIALLEAGVSLAVRVQHALEYTSGNTPDERVTLITCWPYTTYDHRIVVIGHPIP